MLGVGIADASVAEWEAGFNPKWVKNRLFCGADRLFAPNHASHLRSCRTNSTPGAVRACLETTRGAVFGEKAGWRDEGGSARGHHGATPKAFASRAKPDGLFRESPPGGGSFVRGRRWLGRHSPLRGAARGHCALAAAKTSRRRSSRSL